MKELFSRHPIAAFLIVLVLSPYILAALLLYVVAFVLIVAFETLFAR